MQPKLSYEQEQAIRERQAKQKWAEKQAQRKKEKGHPVYITGIYLTFGNALSLMVTLILASIPACIISLLIFRLFTVFL